MLALVFLPLFLMGQYVVVFWLLRWLKKWHPIFAHKAITVALCVFWLYFVLDMYIAVLLPHGRIERFMKIFGNYWYGVTLYTFMIVGGALLIRFFLLHSRLKDRRWVSSEKTFLASGSVCVLLIALVCVGGHFHAKEIHVTRYETTVHKDGGRLDDLHIALLGDLHLGYSVGPDMMEQMVEKVNACAPDIILIAGDIFDNDYDAIEEPERIVEILRGLKSRYGVYAVYGNHDVAEPIIGGFTFSSGKKKVSDERMDRFVEECGFCLLRDEAALIADSFYLFGRPDERRPGRGIGERMTPAELMRTMDAERPVIVLEHEPKHLGELADAGVDIHLAGHTHDGQFFPFNLVMKLVFENSCGILQKGDMTSIVTSGVGVYGPDMRVGTDAEICDIHVTFR